MPGAVHVNRGAGEVGMSKTPLEVDHEYVRPLGFGPVAVDDTDTVPPTVVPSGCTVTLLTVGQLNVTPSTGGVPVTLQAISTVTCVVSRGAISKGAQPAQVTLPSIVVPDSEIR
jgi:hypothetical protein